ncbi:MAG: nitroreductase family protein [Desulfovibrio sp.]|nr:nitroreductase family protein [Desulfovibrio sp.]
MDRRTFIVAATATLASTFFHGSQAFAKGQIVQLPDPVTTGGKPLMDCLAKRHTDRSLKGGAITMGHLSTLLWSAWGINRSDGRHVVPTAHNKQQLQLYAVLGDGVWLYEPKTNSIVKVLDDDQRSRFDGASVILLYAAPIDDMFAGMHVGSMYQNVGLYCAANGVPNCVKHTNHGVLDTSLPLPKGWRVYISHSLGEYPH